MLARSRTHWDTEAMRQAIEAHDQDAFNRAFDPFVSEVTLPLSHYLRKKFDVISWEDCRNFTQEALVVTWAKAFSGQVKDLEKLDSYCYTTARQMVTKAMRNRKGMQFAEIDDQATNSEDWYPYYRKPHLAEVDRAWAMLKRLGKKCQKILIRFGQGAPMAQIAQEFNYSSADTAKTTKARCLKKLKDQLNAED